MYLRWWRPRECMGLLKRSLTESMNRIQYPSHCAQYSNHFKTYTWVECVTQKPPPHMIRDAWLQGLQWLQAWLQCLPKFLHELDLWGLKLSGPHFNDDNMRILGYLNFLFLCDMFYSRKGRPKTYVKLGSHLKKRGRVTYNRLSKEFRCKWTFKLCLIMHFVNLCGHRITLLCNTFSYLSPSHIPMDITYDLKTQILSNTFGNYGLIIPKATWNSN